MNNQKPDKREVRTDGRLSVNSIFPTIQGEGPFTGWPAIFIRLAGCNLQCPLCDTEYSNKRLMTLTEIGTEVILARAENKIKLVVITGGEPFRQEIGPLILGFYQDGYTVQIETNGTLAPPDIPYEQYRTIGTQLNHGVYVVCSPKAGRVNPETERIACCYKYVMTGRSMDPVDGLPMLALDHMAHPKLARPPAGFKRPIYLQPVDEQDAKKNAYNLKACVESCMEHGYILQLQTHKIIGVP